MFSPRNNRFGIPGVISVIALVFAMFGGAYAATNDGGKATSSAKAKKGPRGPKGPKGDTGPAGPAGPAGPQGAKGDTGAAGSNGSNGANGVSPTGTSFSGIKGSCTEGGVEYKGATTNLVCNGQQGIEGEPWTELGALPSEQTETGAWLIRRLAVPVMTEEEEGKIFSQQAEAPISFAIPLENGLGASSVHIISKVGKELPGELTQTDCPGTAAAPSAEPGHLCVYIGETGGEIEAGAFAVKRLDGALENGASTAGARVTVVARANASLNGSWAVTAP